MKYIFYRIFIKFDQILRVTFNDQLQNFVKTDAALWAVYTLLTNTLIYPQMYLFIIMIITCPNVT